MPSCSKAKNPRGIEIKFEENTHKYTSIVNGREIDYISGTTFVGKFFPPFDPTGEITKACARRRGLTVEALKLKWREKADNSCIFGTKIHESCEDTLLGRKLRNHPENLREELTMNNAIKFSKEILKRAEILGIEEIVFDERLRIAGTMDLFIKSKKNGKYVICDWKTNENIDIDNKYNNFGLYPIENIPSTNYGHYCCQLSLYEYILKESGYIPKDSEVLRCLFHVTDKGVKTLSLPDYQKEIKLMIDEYKKGLK